MTASIKRGLYLVCGLMWGWALLFRTPHWLAGALAGAVCLAVAYRLPRGASWRWKPLLAACLLFTVLVALLGEGIVRLMVPATALGGTARFQFDPVCGWTMRPNSSGTRGIVLDDGTLGSVTVRISAQGFREREIGPKAPGEYRIAMIGDSFTFGTGLRDEETISARLEQRLKDAIPGKHATVMNLGCGGYGPWQAHALLLERGLALQPDLVILQLFLNNDVFDTTMRRGIPLRAYTPLEARYKTYFLHFTSDWRIRADIRLQEYSRLFKLLFVRSSGRIGLARLLDSTRLFHREPDYLNLPPTEPRNGMLEIYRADWYPVLQEGWEAMEQDILATRDDCAQRGIGFIVYVVPGQYEMSEQAWTRAAQGDSPPGFYDREKPARSAETFFQREGLAHVQVKEALAAAPDVNALYFALDGHLKPSGADIVAQAVASYLTSEYFPRGTSSRSPGRQ